MPEEKKKFRFPLKKLWIAVVGLIAVICLLSCFTVIPAGHVGVRITMGRVEDQVLTEGMNFKLPFVSQIVKMSVQRQSTDLPETQGELSGRETVNLSMTMTYELDPNMAPEVYRKAGAYYENTLMPTNEIFDIVKGVVAGYSIDEFAARRSEIMTRAREMLTEHFSGRGITITSLSLSNYGFDPELEAAIARMNTAQQQQKTAEIENSTAIAKAEADAKVKKTAAEAEAEAMIIKAEAQAEANKKLAESLTGVLIEYEKIQQWDGQLPKVSTGSTGALIGIGMESLEGEPAGQTEPAE